MQFSSNMAGQRRGLHTVRRLSPRTQPRVPGSMQTRSYYIVQDHALNMIKAKGFRVRESGSSRFDPSVSITVDRATLSPCITVTPSADRDPWRFPFDYNDKNFRNIAKSAVERTADHLRVPKAEKPRVVELLIALWKIFRKREALSLEARIGTSTDGALEVRGVRFQFDDAAFKSVGRHETIYNLRDNQNEVPEEAEAEKDGIVYVK